MAEMDEENTAPDFTSLKKSLKRPSPECVSCSTLFPKALLAEACSWRVEWSFESTGPGARRACVLGHQCGAGGSTPFPCSFHIWRVAVANKQDECYQILRTCLMHSGGRRNAGLTAAELT